MPIYIQSKTRYSGSVIPDNLNIETTVVEIGGQVDDYLIEGYIDLSTLASGDEVEVREYIAVDGVNYQLFTKVTYSDVVSEPVIRFHTKTLLYNMKYKVTIIQTKGILRDFPYGFIVEVMGGS
jgi:hypothetical protein